MSKCTSNPYTLAASTNIWAMSISTEELMTPPGGMIIDHTPNPTPQKNNTRKIQILDL